MRKLSFLLILIFAVAANAQYGEIDTSGLKNNKCEDFSFLHISDIHVSPYFTMPDEFSKLRSYGCCQHNKRPE